MNLDLLIILIIMIIFIIIFLYIEPLFMKHKVKNSNEYGSARFSTLNEIKKNFKSENIYNIKEAGFPVSFLYCNFNRTIFIYILILYHTSIYSQIIYVAYYLFQSIYYLNNIVLHIS